MGPPNRVSDRPYLAAMNYVDPGRAALSQPAPPSYLIRKQFCLGRRKVLPLDPDAGCSVRRANRLVGYRGYAHRLAVTSNQFRVSPRHPAAFGGEVLRDEDVT